MALDEYRKKRDFTTSPEPTGDSTKARGRRALSFCVQKHMATQLHYDFRLEHDGVLLSWAVPKGPSLDPSVKRLAMHVEDHPFDYGSFEGVIPSGYGAGIVMLWDTGTWTPEVADVDAALEKGDLKFSLDGYKLKGSWALVRTRGYGGNRDDGRSWLLIKHRDDWSGDLDITTFAPLSVKSGQDFHEILAEDRPDIWETNRPANTGESGKRFEQVIRQAAELKAERAGVKASDPKKTRAPRKTSSTPRPGGRAQASPTKTPKAAPRKAGARAGAAAKKRSAKR